MKPIVTPIVNDAIMIKIFQSVLTFTTPSFPIICNILESSIQKKRPNKINMRSYFFSYRL